jgi:putative ABC transport system permease protein
VVLAATGVVSGSLASLVTIVPYSIARTDSVLPDTGVAMWLGIVAVAAALTLAASLWAARRSVQAPAVEAAAVASA